MNAVITDWNCDASVDAYFAALRRNREDARAARREEIRAALEAGRKCLETTPGGFSVVWPDQSPFLPTHNTPERLSRHLEAREDGLGFVLEIRPPGAA